MATRAAPSPPTGATAIAGAPSSHEEGGMRGDRHINQRRITGKSALSLGDQDSSMVVINDGMSKPQRELSRHQRSNSEEISVNGKRNIDYEREIARLKQELNLSQLREEASLALVNTLRSVATIIERPIFSFSCKEFLSLYQL